MAHHPLAPAGTGHVALLGNFLPRRCGLATFTTHCHDALVEQFPDLTVDVYAMDDRAESYAYPPAVTHSIPQHDRAAYLDAARRIEASGAQALWVQHEYGIYGGAAGEHLLALIDRLTIPVVVMLHTILEQPSPDERRVIEALIARAARVMVMAERGREILMRTHGTDTRKIVTVPHGVPDRPLVAPDSMKEQFGWQGRKVVLTFGLLAPSKGIETLISAVPAIAARHPEALYIVLGATHPNVVAHEGEAYRQRLKADAEALGVAEHVRFIDGFIEQEELLDYLQAADVYATPYPNPAQITSGTLSYAVGVGAAVVSTPYVHATEILADNHGIIVPFGDSAGFADAINGLFDEADRRDALSARAYARGRTMLWPRLADTAMAVIEDAIERQPRVLRVERSADHPPLEPDLAAVIRMSDGTGMLQHAIHSVPDRRHGYCIDDNARAFILMHRIDPLDDQVRDEWTTVYASFIQHAWNEDQRRFRNFMGFDRQWLEDTGSEDSNGRTLWALGVGAAEGRIPKHRIWAGEWFERTAPIALNLGSPRARAFAMLGAAAYLEARPDHGVSHTILTRFGEELTALLDAARRPEWEWFEIVLAYDNARLPEALLRAGQVLERQDFIDTGLATLEWIVSRQTSPDGRFRAVGTDSFGRAYADPLPFDQQPLEAQATIDACAAAFHASGDTRWIDEAERAYRWYLGVNDLDLPLASGADGGCFDGLMPSGLNRNQGAESILALQLASCAISALSKRRESVSNGQERAA
ncbi:glycosyltransferase family 4 protein [Sphingomonas sp. BGYR3]|uniref:glycosyltransferase family 4 protein n=1 Tax=Sphingomonas sp. BGYR3 TaxID=2975483 RepID=UPI0021A8F2B7|nr:glycosyltransferase family 4 protein [Sphingomonas sp. BGYR3]MDG5487924.1 glycosyltransferase family 4 protein [Sphingomonas sp. BGYR3]